MCKCINKVGKVDIFSNLRPQLLEPSELHGKVARGHRGEVCRGSITFSLVGCGKEFDFV